MNAPSLMPQSLVHATIEQIVLVGSRQDLRPFPSLCVFWENWITLHKRFLRKLERFGSESAVLHGTLEAEIQKLLKKRQAFISSALQFFHATGANKTQEARLFSYLVNESDTVLVAALNEEISRLRRIFSRSVKSSQVIRAYSGQRAQLR